MIVDGLRLNVASATKQLGILAFEHHRAQPLVFTVDGQVRRAEARPILSDEGGIYLYTIAIGPHMSAVGHTEAASQGWRITVRAGM